MSAHALPTLTGTWVVDPSRSTVGFTIKHFGVATVRGRFREFEGTLDIGEDLRAATAGGRVLLASLDTGDGKRDDGLRAEVLEVQTYPEMTFRSVAFSPLVGDRCEITGDLALHGQIKRVMLTTTVGDLVQDAAGDDRLELTLTGQVHRSDFGMRFPATSNAIVSDKVVLTLQISAVRQR